MKGKLISPISCVELGFMDGGILELLDPIEHVILAIFLSSILCFSRNEEGAQSKAYQGISYTRTQISNSAHSYQPVFFMVC